jgi:hypothetical protein
MVMGRCEQHEEAGAAVDVVEVVDVILFWASANELERTRHTRKRDLRYMAV